MQKKEETGFDNNEVLKKFEEHYKFKSLINKKVKMKVAIRNYPWDHWVIAKTKAYKKVDLWFTSYWTRDHRWVYASVYGTVYHAGAISVGKGRWDDGGKAKAKKNFDHAIEVPQCSIKSSHEWKGNNYYWCLKW